MFCQRQNNGATFGGTYALMIPYFKGLTRTGGASVVAPKVPLNPWLSAEGATLAPMGRVTPLDPSFFMTPLFY